MPNPLEVEVTIRITVNLDYFDGLTHDQICEYVRENQTEEIVDADWYSVTVRVADSKEATECKP